MLLDILYVGVNIFVEGFNVHVVMYDILHIGKAVNIHLCCVNEIRVL